MTNLNLPGMKDDSGKNRVALVLGGFASALLALSKVGTFGANKYTPNGWKTVANGEERYEDAMLRHWLAHKSGEEKDPESHLSHLSHFAWNALAILTLKEQSNGSKTDCVQPSTERAEDCNIRAGVPAIHPCGADDTPSVQPERAVFPSSASEQGPISSALSDAVRVRQKQIRYEFVYDPFLRKLVPVQSGVASDGDSRLPWLPSSR